MEAIAANGGREDQKVRERKHVDPVEANGHEQHEEDEPEGKERKTYGRTPDGTSTISLAGRDCDHPLT